MYAVQFVLYFSSFYIYITFVLYLVFLEGRP